MNWRFASFPVVIVVALTVAACGGTTSVPPDPGADTAPSFAETVADQLYIEGEAIATLALPSASGGDGILSYSLTPDVPGLSFNRATHVLSGTPIAAGIYQMTYQVHDADTNTSASDSATLTFTIAVQPTDPTVIPEPMPVPLDVRSAFNLDPFYQQWIDVGGLPVVASPSVSPYAVKEAAWLITQMIGHRPEVLRALGQNGARIAVMAHDEFTTDIPEHSDLIPDFYWDVRARGLGPNEARLATSCGEENLLSYQGDPYSTENVLIHEFAHAIHLMGLEAVDPGFDDKLAATFDRATKQGLWRTTYAFTNKEEYWAEGTQSWFDTNRENDDLHNHVDTREELKTYDPELAKLLTDIYGDGDWRYTPATSRTYLPHLQGFDPQLSPVFEWPPELRNLLADLRNAASDGEGKWVDLKPYDPSQLHNARSHDGDTETAIIFVNLTSAQVSLYWVDHNGMEVRFGSAVSAGFFTQGTYDGHLWIAKGMNGEILSGFRAESRTGRALIQ